MTKVGVYAILRVHGLIFGPEAGPAASLAMPWLIPVGLLTIVLATLGVLASRDLQRMLAHLVVLSAGTLITAAGIGSTQALSGALLYLLNSTLVGGGLFLVAGLVADGRGQAGGRLDLVTDLPGRALLGGLFFLGAIGVAGLPPLAGFAAKVYVLQSALEHPGAGWIVGVVLATGLLVILALSRAGSALFWRTGEAGSKGEAPSPVALVGASFLLLGTVALMIAAGPVTAYTQATATQLDDRAGYVEAVMANRGVSRPANETRTH
jgi:multicomponent K+:H+ antiporter subunit D